MIRVITEDGYIQYINPTFIIKVYNDGDNKTRIVLANNATLCTKKTFSARVDNYDRK